MNKNKIEKMKLLKKGDTFIVNNFIRKTNEIIQCINEINTKEDVFNPIWENYKKYWDKIK